MTADQMNKLRNWLAVRQAHNVAQNELEAAKQRCSAANKAENIAADNVRAVIGVGANIPEKNFMVDGMIIRITRVGDTSHIDVIEVET